MKSIITFCLFLATLEITAQRNDKIWYFGNKAGISFLNGQPEVLLNGQLETADNSATISDSSGKLLFYSNGEKIWNRNHVVMENGSGLHGHYSGGQSAVIVPSVGTTKYFVFTVALTAGPNGLKYSVVDMSLNGGLGSVVEKNIPVLSRTTEKLESVRSPDGNFYWLIAHGWNDSKFYAYRVTAAGLDMNPVISDVGAVHDGDSYNSMGQMTLSPNSTKLALGLYISGLIEIFDFNITTGKVGNPKTIDEQINPWGIAFSKNGKKLYSTAWFGQDVFQFDLTAGNANAIKSSRRSVGKVTGPGTDNYYVGYLQLAPDGKIYAAKYDDTYLATINFPDSSALKCGFQDDGFYLGGKVSRAGLSRSPIVITCSDGKSIAKGFPIPGDPCDPISIMPLKSINWNIWPNPATDIININVTNLQATISNLRILDQLGREIPAEIFQKSHSDNWQIGIRHLDEGIYWVKLITADRSYFHKFIKAFGN
jgi:hypothetical protein